MLFRYMNIDKFTDLCDSSALTFVNPLKFWLDKREGPLFRSLKEGKGIKKLEKESIKYGAEKQEALRVILGVVPNVRAQCWTHAKDDPRMWREYGDYGVMIASSLESLRSIPSTKRYDVRYVDDPISIQSEIEHIVLKQGIHVSSLFLTKRKAEFAYEQEVRIFYTKGIVDGKMRPDLIKVPVNLPELIHSVMLCYGADKTIETEVVKLCYEHGLRYVGKSKCRV